MEGLIAVIYL